MCIRCKPKKEQFVESEKRKSVRKDRQRQRESRKEERKGKRARERAPPTADKMLSGIQDTRPHL